MIEGTVEHDYFLLAVENLAKSLKKCQDADVPILFRPFHEAERQRRSGRSRRMVFGGVRKALLLMFSSIDIYMIY